MMHKQQKQQPTRMLLRFNSVLLLKALCMASLSHAWMISHHHPTTTHSTRLLRSPLPRCLLSPTTASRRSRHYTLLQQLQQPDSGSESSSSSTTTTTTITSVLETLPSTTIDDEDTPAGIVGAEFFGGSKQKQEFYDPEAEIHAGEGFFKDIKVLEEVERKYDRFQDPQAFDTGFTRSFARAFQESINSILIAGKKEEVSSPRVTFASDMQWISPLNIKELGGKTQSSSSSTTQNLPPPWKALADAQNFYRNIAVAITGGRQIDDNKLELYWEAAVTWPIFWAPRVLLCLRSELSLSGGPNKQEIVRQVDHLFGGSHSSQDLTSLIATQVLPRFWDFYHIGMTPSTELSPRAVAKSTTSSQLLSSYKVYDVPPRLYWQPSLLDQVGGREDASAANLPNHGFTCAIKTMGPQKQDYTPTSPVQVQLLPITASTPTNTESNENNSKSNKPQQLLRLQWNIPVAVETLMQKPVLPGVNGDIEDETISPEALPRCEYVWQGPRRVATVPYGGGPQDAAIATLRQQLYTQVVKDGWKPRLDVANGNRPLFFFWQNAVKACYTDEGLGMAVYEWRPKFTKPNEVGIELEL